MIYKISETNGFFIYKYSNIYDFDIVAEHAEHYIANKPNITENKYFLSLGFDNIKIEPTNYTFEDYSTFTISKSGNIYNDIVDKDKCINLSDKYTEYIVEKKPKEELTEKESG